jgi:transcriptional regulator with XRE-family HTH domain
MVDRIKQLMEHYQLSPASFAEVIGINRSNLTHLFSGRNQPSLDLAKKILHYYPDIKTEWLIMGVGDMFRNNEEKELQTRITNERKLQEEMREPDLFSAAPPIININAVESPIEEKKEINEEISDSPEVERKMASIAEKPAKESKTLNLSVPVATKIVFFYSDNSFEVFHPNK